jgi:uncharacterized membrane protein YheB (UPF0754 family)
MTLVKSSYGRFDWKDKSFLTNLLSALCILLGYISPYGGPVIRDMGWFALSGAITNWLAIFMLFERIPGLYGSGIIPLKFEEFKIGIKKMIMNQFFTRENIERFMSSQSGKSFESHILLEAIDFELLFEKLLAAVQNSPFGAMLAMFGGVETLKSGLRVPFEQKMREAIQELVQSEKFTTLVKRVLAQDFSSDHWSEKIDQVVTARLNELTPNMVKEIIQEMIRSHLGWLVIWGGVFGGLMGLLAGLMRN